MILSPLRYAVLHERLKRRLTRAFPKLCAGVVEDAVLVGIAAWCMKPDAAVTLPGSHGLRWMYRIAWRYARGACRRRGFSRERAPERACDLDAPMPASQESGLAVDEMVERLVPVAASRYGGARVSALEAALRDRIVDGGTDKEAAGRHGIPREYLSRARSWLGDALVAEGVGA